MKCAAFVDKRTLLVRTFFIVSHFFLFIISLSVPLLSLGQYLSFVDVDFWLLLRSPVLLQIVSSYFLGVMVLSFGLHFFLSRRKTWAYVVYFFVEVVLWGLVSIALVIKKSSFSVAIANLAVLAFIISTGSVWMRHYSKSFFDSGRRWFEGTPSPIPGVNCVANGAHWKVSRLDREGAYVFLDEPRPLEFKGQLQFAYRGLKVDVPAVLVHQSKDFTGFGFRFKFNDADLRKDLGDFIEKMRGYGYES